MSKWLKVVGIAAVVLVVVSAFALVVSAQGPRESVEDVQRAFGWRNDGLGCDGECADFVDADGDGACDNEGQRVEGRMGWANNGEGCDGECENFVDADGDGVCDNEGDGQRMLGGRGGRMGGGRGGRGTNAR